MARWLLACLLALSLPLTACVMDGGAAPTLSVEASLSSVSLADDCPAAGEPGSRSVGSRRSVVDEKQACNSDQVGSGGSAADAVHTKASHARRADHCPCQ